MKRSTNEIMFSFFLMFVWQMEAVISSTIYLACREEGYPRTMKEMCAVGTVTKKDLGKVFKQVLECVMMLLNV